MLTSRATKRGNWPSQHNLSGETRVAIGCLRSPVYTRTPLTHNGWRLNGRKTSFNLCVAVIVTAGCVKPFSPSCPLKPTHSVCKVGVRKLCFSWQKPQVCFVHGKDYSRKTKFTGINVSLLFWELLSDLIWFILWLMYCWHRLIIYLTPLGWKGSAPIHSLVFNE